jgi:hypothetical protein
MSLIFSMILSEKSATFRDHALTEVGELSELLGKEIVEGDPGFVVVRLHRLAHIQDRLVQFGVGYGQAELLLQTVAHAIALGLCRRTPPTMRPGCEGRYRSA